MSKAASTSFLDLSSEDEEDIESQVLPNEEDLDLQSKNKPLKRGFDAFSEDDEDDEDHNEEEQGQEGDYKGGDVATEHKEGDDAEIFLSEDLENLTKESKIVKSKRNKKLTPEQLAKQQKKLKKTGVVYLSSLPPYMKPTKMRQILSRFGDVDRLYLKPEDILTQNKRVRFGGNKKRMYTEGWAEYLNKKDAKLAAETLNANSLGGKKGTFYYDDIINIKYLSGFKWHDLTEQIAKENESREAKLRQELTQENKLSKVFISNVEKSRNIERKREKYGPSKKDEEIRRTFHQKDIASRRADAPAEIKKQKKSEKLEGVLSKVF
ncbi:BA75_04099T0 [Komagataella pastoris]|uniref:Pre-rRNA-processing protein ESF2 n=1 Tax=Komagataella pastoris TaxID=4922 RepID=A0A1B2JFY3_PICPA|nr:BA75_04099T0 [Komagataella pastoris]